MNQPQSGNDETDTGKLAGMFRARRNCRDGTTHERMKDERLP
jgi:hypothetical protein